MLLFVAAGCRAPTAATTPGGEPIRVLVDPDRTLAPDVSPERSDQLNQLVTWMAEDLTKLLRRVGYASASLEDASTATGLNSYVLRFQVTRYDAGGPSGWFVDRTGALSRIDAHFELVGSGDEIVAEGNASIEGTDWRKVARLVDKQIRDAVNGNLRLGY